MTFGYYYNLNNSPYSHNLRFKANNSSNAATPVNNTSPMERSIDTFFSKVDKEKEKKSNKKAITVGATVFSVLGILTLLNPKNSTKLMSKLKSAKQKTQLKLEKSTNDYKASRFHRFCSKMIDKGIAVLQFSNNFNSAKDMGFKWLCTEQKNLHKIRDYKKRKFVRKIDDGFIGIMKKPHEAITKWFDSISKATVKSKYAKSAKKLNYLEDLLKKYRTNVPESERGVIDAKLQEIAECRKHFSESKTMERLLKQEESMATLERDVMNKYHAYRNGFSNKWIDKGQHIGTNMTFWAEEIMMPTRNKFENQGKEVVDKLIGNGKDKKGLYDEIFDIISPHINSAEKQELSKVLNKTGSNLRKANYSECVEYFDKKRDLVLGSAPTDILSALFGLGICGWAVAAADTKEDRLSKALTIGFPIIAGLGTSLALTAMLVSGIKSMLYGTLASLGLSKLGSLADHYLLGNNNDTKTTTTTKEVKNA